LWQVERSDGGEHLDLARDDWQRGVLSAALPEIPPTAAPADTDVANIVLDLI
jgi:hypothetical protein